MCADRGVTGRIMRSYFGSLLDAILGLEVAAWFARHLTFLSMEIECEATPCCLQTKPNPGEAELMSEMVQGAERVIKVAEIDPRPVVCRLRVA